MQIEVIDYKLKWGYYLVTLGTDESEFGTLEVALSDLDAWLSDTDNNIISSTQTDVDEWDEIRMQCDDLFDWLGWSKSRDLICEYIVENKLIQL